MARFQFPLMSALPLLVLTAAISTIGDELSAQPVNGHIVLARDGVDASDFDGVHYKIPHSTILFQSDEGPNFFLGYFRGKLVAVERGSISPIQIARDQVAQSVSTNPTEENWTLLGIIEEFLRQLEPAREAAGQALKLNPQNVDAMFVIALVNYRASEYEDCVAICDDALVLAPDRLDIAARRAAALANLDRTDEAIARYQEILERDPLMAPVWSNLGAAWERMSDRQKSIECFNKAVETDPGYWHGWCCLAITEDDASIAKEYWEKCFQARPNTYIPYYQATSRISEFGDLAEYHRLMRLQVQFPDCPDYYKQQYALRLATTSRDEFRDGQTALNILNELTKVDGREEEVLSYQLTISLAAAYAETGDFKKAMQLLDSRRELEHDPTGLRMFESFENGDPWRVDY